MSVESHTEYYVVSRIEVVQCHHARFRTYVSCFFYFILGGNLIVALTLKLIEEGLRLPDGIVPAYPPLRVQYAPAPSRMLALMDPLLPPGILKLCLRAYAGGVHEDVIRDSSSTNSLRTPVFDDFYNPFDLDLGDVAYAARLRNESVLTGKRSYSDTNLVTGGHYCVSRPVPGCLKCGDLSNRVQKVRAPSDVVENEAEDDYLKMHPIPPVASEPIETQGTVSTGSTSVGSSITECVFAKESSIVSGNNRHFGVVDKDGDESSDSVGDVVNSSSGSVPHQVSLESHATNIANYAIVRRSKSLLAPNHRRSMSDSIAESFQRLQPNSDDFEMARKLSGKNVESLDNGAEKERTGSRNSSPREQGNHFNINILQSSNTEISNQTIDHKTEYKALFIRETSECVIIDRDNIAVKSAASSSSSFFGKIEKAYERQESSDSITSSVRQASRDPLMSPLLASDEILRKFPKLIIVVSTMCICVFFVGIREQGLGAVS